MFWKVLGENLELGILAILVGTNNCKIPYRFVYIQVLAPDSWMVKELKATDAAKRSTEHFFSFQSIGWQIPRAAAAEDHDHDQDGIVKGSFAASCFFSLSWIRWGLIYCIRALASFHSVCFSLTETLSEIRWGGLIYCRRADAADAGIQGQEAKSTQNIFVHISQPKNFEMPCIEHQH